MTCNLKDGVVTWVDPPPVSGCCCRPHREEALTPDGIGSVEGLRDEVISMDRHHGRNAFHSSV